MSLPREVKLLVTYIEATRQDSDHYEIFQESRSLWIDDRLREALKTLERADFHWASTILDGEFTISKGQLKDWSQVPGIVKTLSVAGECASLVRAKDWSRTPLGPITTWAPELITMLSTVLSSGLPMTCFWGPEHIMFYNDAYIPLTRKQHPRMIGMKCSEAWSEVWHELEGPFRDVFNGKHMMAEDQLFMIWRDDLQLFKESYFTWSLPHVRNSAGEIVGVLNPVTSTTSKCIGDRRDRLVRSVRSAFENLWSTERLLESFLDVVIAAAMDVSFVIIFTRRSTTAADVCPLHWELFGHRGDLDEQYSCRPETWRISLPIKFCTEAKIQYKLHDIPSTICSHTAVPVGTIQAVRQALVIQYAPDFFYVLGIPPTDPDVDQYLLFANSLTRTLRTLQRQLDFQDLEVKKAQNAMAIQGEQQLRHEAEDYRLRGEEFIDMVCHEIRNPINSILHTSIYVCDILETPLPEYQAENTAIREARRADIIESLRTIIKCATHQTRIANDVLEASKIDMDRLELVSIPMQPKEIVESLFKQYRVELHEVAITTRLVVSQRAEALNVSWTLGDPQRLLQILINLLSNAIKFTKQSTNRNIEVHMDAETIEDAHSDAIWLHFSVRDSGIGLTAKEQESLFARFSQASSKTFNDYGGSGLGLYISKRLVEMQGGKITIYSNPELESGTRFNFSIKSRLCREPAPSAIRQEKAKVVPTNISALRVLILEDNPINRKVLARLVEGLGHEVRTGDDGLQGLHLVANEHFDIVLCDCEMPNLDGLEFTRRIRQIETATAKRVPLTIIAVSGNVREQQIHAALKAGMNSHIAKPYSRDDILRVLTQYAPQQRIKPDISSSELNRGVSPASVIDKLVNQMRLRGQT